MKLCDDTGQFVSSIIRTFIQNSVPKLNLDVLARHFNCAKNIKLNNDPKFKWYNFMQ